MTDRPSLTPYTGVRDFYPEDMAVLRYIFDTWAHSAEKFGFERYDASILEPAELYRAKSSEEIVNEQTYTFTDRGDREVTLRPEMTPTVARMIAQRRRELAFPVRWYSIPNLFRYERKQRGRLREHWQLNCDIFGSEDIHAEVEIIGVARDIFLSFGASESDFEIRVNHRSLMGTWFTSLGVSKEQIPALTRLIDRKNKIEQSEFEKEASDLVGASLRKFLEIFESASLSSILEQIGQPEKENELYRVIEALEALGIRNVRFDPTIARGFDYYTGTVFEVFDTNPENRRSLLGGGRYDNLVGLLGGEAIPAVGFGFGDVTMRDFLEVHNLLSRMGEEYRSAPTVMIVTPQESYLNNALLCAQNFRAYNIRTAVNLSSKKLGDQIKNAVKMGTPYAVVVGEEYEDGNAMLKDLKGEKEELLPLSEIINRLS